MGAGAYSPAQKSQAKALALTLGNSDAAERRLKELWPDGAPTGRAISNWVNDPEIEADARFIKLLAQAVDAKIIGQVGNLLDPLYERLKHGIGKLNPETGQWEGAKSLDLHNDSRSYVFLSNLIRPANASGNGGTNQFTQFVDARGAQVVLPFSAKPEPTPIAIEQPQ